MRAPITIFIEQPNAPNLDRLIDSLIKTHDESFAEAFVNKTLLIDPQSMDEKVIKAYGIWTKKDFPSHHRLYKGSGPGSSEPSSKWWDCSPGQTRIYHLFFRDVGL